jgi:hypothetical protein
MVRRDASEQRQPKPVTDLAGGAKPGVEPLPKECQSGSEDRAEQQSEQPDAEHLRLDLARRVGSREI